MLYFINLFRSIDLLAQSMDIDIACKRVNPTSSNTIIMGQYIRPLKDDVALYSCYNSEDGVERAYLVYEGNERNLNYIAREAEVTPKISNNNALHVLDAWEESDGELSHIICITEYVSETTLMFMNTVKGINVNVLKKWICQLLDVVYGIHYGASITDQSIPALLHRDICCENIYVEKSTGSIKLGGFGYSNSVISPELGYIEPNVYYKNAYRDKYVDDIKACGYTILRWCLQTKDLMPAREPSELEDSVITNDFNSEHLHDTINLVSDPELRDFIKRCFEDNIDAEKLLNDPLIKNFPQINDLIEKSTIDGLKHHSRLIPILTSSPSKINKEENDIGFDAQYSGNNKIYHIKFNIPCDNDGGNLEFTFKYDAINDTPIKVYIIYLFR